MQAAIAMPVVAIANTNEDIIELLRVALEQEGFATALVYLTDVKNGRSDFNEFMGRHDPDVIVFDIPPPLRRQLDLRGHAPPAPEDAGARCRHHDHAQAASREAGGTDGRAGDRRQAERHQRSRAGREAGDGEEGATLENFFYRLALGRLSV